MDCWSPGTGENWREVEGEGVGWVLTHSHMGGRGLGVTPEDDVACISESWKKGVKQLLSQK